MNEYLYVPDDDSEYGPIWDVDIARETFNEEDLVDARSVELVIARDGGHGHYLMARFLEDAADIMRNKTRGVDAPGTEDELATALNWRRVADNYIEHGGSYCPDDTRPHPETGLCTDCENIHDDVDAAENVLRDRGFLVTWIDGYVIYYELTD